MATRRLVSQASASGADDELASLIDELSVELLAAGGLPVGDVQPGKLQTIASSSSEALGQFMAGESHMRSADWTSAVAAFERARDADPAFAMASLRVSLARLYATLPEPGSGDADVERASAPPSRLPQGDRLLAEGLDRFLNGSGDAVTALRQATADFPGDPDAWFVLGDALYHRSNQDGSGYQDALERAIELIPGFGPAYAHLIDGALAAGDPAAAAAWAAAFRAESPASPLLGRLDAAVTAATATTQPTDDPVVSDPPRVDPLAETRTRYAELSTTVAGVRDQTRNASHGSLSSRLGVADSMWAASTVAAGQDRYDEAIATLGRAGPLYDALVADNRTLQGIESDRTALTELRASARDPALVADAEAAEREADEAIAQGRYPAATAALSRAAGLLRQAAQSPAPPPDDPTGGDEPEPIQPTVVAEQALRALKSGMEARDLDRVRAVWTSMTDGEASGWESLFSAASSLTATYRIESAVERGGRVIATIRSSYVYVISGRDQPSPELRQIFELEETGTAWVIVASRTEG